MSAAEVDTDAVRFQTIQQLTNERQAAKVCSVGSIDTLVLEYAGGRTIYVRALDGGLYGVGIGSGGGLYFNGFVDGPQVTAMAAKADVDVHHKRRGLPRAVVDPKPGGGDA